MIELSLVTRNATLVRQGLERLRRAVPAIGRRRIYDALLAARRLVVEYPPVRGAQTYVRTGTYKRGWTVEPTAGSDGMGYMLKGRAVDRNGVDYTRFVGGDAQGKGQAWMHQGRFWTARGAVLAETQDLPRLVQQDLDVVAQNALDGRG